MVKTRRPMKDAAARGAVTLGLTAVALLAPHVASANGCIVVRPTSQLSVAAMDAHDPAVGQWDFTAAYRYLFSDRHFRGTHEEPNRQALETDVRNSIHTVDYTIGYRLDEDWRFTASIPYINARRSSLYEHDFVNRHTMSAVGIGDLRMMAYRDFSLDTEAPTGITLGVGIKFPTGKDDVKDIAHVGSGPELRTVDQSIQLGDGGLGAIAEAQIFRQFANEQTYAFASGSYLINPRETNGVRTFRETLSPALANEAIMSVPDQYQVRAGIAHRMQQVQGLTLELSLRAEGVPVRDLIGGDDGFRRPGYAVSIEPGVTYSQGPHLLNLSMPYAVQRNRRQSVTDMERGSHGDAAFADSIFLFNYSYTF